MLKGEDVPLQFGEAFHCLLFSLMASANLLHPLLAAPLSHDPGKHWRGVIFLPTYSLMKSRKNKCARCT